MDGLEATEIKLSDLERTLRVDSEFYQKKNLNLLEKLRTNKLANIEDVAFVSDGNHMKISHRFSDKGIPYYRGQDTSDFFIENSNPIFIDENAYNETTMKRSHLKKGDVLVSIVGTIGNLSLVYSNQKATCSCKLAILRSKEILPEVLAIFLKSKYGQNQIEKFTRGAVQMGLILEDMNQLYIPKFSNIFQNYIQNITKTSHEKLKYSKKLYTEAENILLEELGLKDWKPTEKNKEIKTLKSSFELSGRLDAEYYQPKYNEIEEQIKKYNYNLLTDIVKIKKSIEPGSSAYNDKGIPFIRVSNLSKYAITKTNIKISESLSKNDLKPKKDTILFTKDGSIGIAYKVESDLNIVTSGAILHLNLKTNEVLPDYLTIVLNSLIVQLQAQRDVGGSVIQHWRINEIENVIIPILPLAMQENISQKIRESFKLKETSKQLLETAKLAVEKSIEINEEYALNWTENEISTYGVKI